eukprot:symbB.v1.2.011056.t3/scaffold728.1/size168468/4
MVKRWLWATATVSAALAVHGALRGHLRRAAAAALTAVLLATATRQHSRGTTVTSGGRPARYPKQYVARKATVQPIDGDLEKAVWSSVPWSEDFVEIRGGGAPTSAKPTKWEATRVKMLWDDEYLYIGAMMDVDAGNELIAKFKERNSPIFHTDSDFEVFLDPAGCCHGYKELEINALNTASERFWSHERHQKRTAGCGFSPDLQPAIAADFLQVRSQGGVCWSRFDVDLELPNVQQGCQQLGGGWHEDHGCQEVTNLHFFSQSHGTYL